MDVLNIYPISGLFNELYSPNVSSYNCEPLDSLSTDPLYRLNALFWAKLLSHKNLDLLIQTMESSDKNKWGYIEQAVIANKSLFKSLISQAAFRIVNQGISDQLMFAYMEQIEIACKLFSKYLYSPFYLTIQDGFQELNLSSKVLMEGLFDESNNPYLPFLKENVFPLLSKQHIKMVWINGQPRQSSFAIAAYIKQENPDAFIAIRYHSSEYFSLNKINEFLLNNYSLFSLVDCIVLDDSKETCRTLEEIVFKDRADLNTCRNIIFIDRSKDKIRCSTIEKVKYSFEESVNKRPVDNISESGYISPHEIINLKLNPNTACYWNKCSFCAINRKYKFITNEETQSLDEKLKYIEQYIREGIKYFWFEDEAITPLMLNEFADAILSRGLQFKWQARSRIDTDFTEALAKKLFQAGMREIRFGLESGSMRILKLMNKFPENVSLETVENIVRICTDVGIHVHFPMIVGFPTEQPEERIETYLYLIKLRDQYKHVSYNINILMLDIASDLYKEYSKYNIDSITFPCSRSEFLGNMVDFGCVSSRESRESIDIKRNEFMRETLYPWMPRQALIKPNIFYRLSETIRNTLIWHSKDEQYAEISKPIKNGVYTKSSYLSEWSGRDDSYMIYNWFTHRLFQLPRATYEEFSSIQALPACEIENSHLYQQLLHNGLIVCLENKNGDV